jgi:hypothetical protein
MWSPSPLCWQSHCGYPAGNMTEDPNHPWGSGKTHYRWREDVRRVVQLTEARFGPVRANTYVCHPWCGWGSASIDFWGEGGRGDPIGYGLGWRVLQFLFELPGKPIIRHTIYEHQLWTSWGGESFWRRDDHTGRLRHVHVTYWP